MKPVLRIATVVAVLLAILVPEVVDAQIGRMRRATRRRTAIVVGASVHAHDEQAAAQQQQAAADQAAADQAAAEQAAVEPQPLPIGTVVNVLPPDCAAPLTVGDAEYHHCGIDYYRDAYQGNALVYVTADPP